MNLKEVYKCVADQIPRTGSNTDTDAVPRKVEKTIMEHIGIRLPAGAHSVGTPFGMESGDKAHPYLRISFFIPLPKKRVFFILAEIQQEMRKYFFGKVLQYPD